MEWQKMPVGDLDITPGMVKILADRFQIVTVGDLAAEWDRDGFARLREPAAFGIGGSGLLQGELRRVSKGASGKEPAVEEPAAVEQPVPELVGAVAAGGEGYTAGPVGAPPIPEGSIVITLDELDRLRRSENALGTIEAMNEDVVKLGADWRHKKDVALQAKKAYDSRNAELNGLIEDTRRGQQRLALGGDNTQPAAATTTEEAKPKRRKKTDKPLDDQLPDKGERPPTFDGPDGWRHVPISKLGDEPGAKMNLLARLEKNGIKTIGALQEMREAKAWPPRFGDDDRDHIIELTDTWLQHNRDKKVFAQAASETETREAEFPRLIVIREQINDTSGRLVHAVGKVCDVVKFGGDGGAPLEVGVNVLGSGLKLDPQQWAPAPATVKRPRFVQLTRDIPGGDGEEKNLRAGVEVEVVGYGEAGNVRVKAKDGSEHLIQAAECEPLEMIAVPVVAGMMLTEADLAG